MGALVHRLIGTPVVATLHGPADATTVEMLRRCATTWRSSPSPTTSATGSPTCDFVGTIPNAIDVEHMPFEAQKDDFFLFIGRMSSDKGAHSAIEVARRLDARLIMAGKVNEGPERAYYAARSSRSSRTASTSAGRWTTRPRWSCTSSARCTLFPIQWPEPFGLVMIESMACGTPVIAMRQGSVPEVVEHGRTGFIVETVDEMVEAFARIDEIDPAECRKAMEERFGIDQFVDAHVAAYKRLLG